jgi:hypothetical protein
LTHVAATRRRRNILAVEKWRKKNPRAAAVLSKKAGCKHAGIECDEAVLREVPCPDLCPVLGTAISFERGSGVRAQQHTASFDRIDPSLGYVRGNVMIISQKANIMKSSATPEELWRFAQWILQEHSSRMLE